MTMKRREFIQWTGAGFVSTLGLAALFPDQPLVAAPRNNARNAPRNTASNGLSIQWLGHMSFVFSGGGSRILANPFRPGGCTAKYPAPRPNVDLVMVSSFLLDEGAVDGLPNNPKLIYDAGVYEFQGIKIQGISVPHDRKGGVQFGQNVIWKWSQGGLNIVNLGGAAAPIGLEQKILLGRPDVLLVPVGGGPKAYNPQEAMQAVQMLNPRLVIPTQYRTDKADANTCDLVGVDEFLSLMSGATIRRWGNSASLTAANLPKDGMIVSVFS